MKVKLRDVASVIRSKNAGPFELTLDVLLKDQETFELLKNADAINKELISRLYHTPEENIISIVYFPNARAIKATIIRPYPSGALQERDVYGAQQHFPLMNAEIELPDA
ncbi:MAG: DUF4387 domain-containing protein [Firmicutes bacterium]|nr:DUF4387 domain-containing protein [Bacillota bacterium]